MAQERTALLGDTGFVGSNLLRQARWDECYHRSNMHMMEGHYSLVVCCAAPGTKWEANQDPVGDYNNLFDKLVPHLYQSVTADRFILVSTADVFGQPVDADEDSKPNPSDTYGRNRFALEMAVQSMGWMEDVFKSVHVVRLPGLVGPGLKKNAIYDLQNERRLEHLNPESVYQWYDVRGLWNDIRDVKVPTLHLCPPPEKLVDTVRRDFPHLEGKLTGRGTPVSYNLRTKYGRK